MNETVGLAFTMRRSIPVYHKPGRTDQSLRRVHRPLLSASAIHNDIQAYISNSTAPNDFDADALMYIKKIPVRPRPAYVEEKQTPNSTKFVGVHTLSSENKKLKQLSTM